jgi:hypothetical protein
MDFHIVKMYKDRVSTKMSKIFFLSMCDVKVSEPVSQMKMTFQEIRIIATGPCITNQLRDVNTICRRSWYIGAHIWKICRFCISGKVSSPKSRTSIFSSWRKTSLNFNSSRTIVIIYYVERTLVNCYNVCPIQLL